MFQENDEIQIQRNLQNTYIALCSVNVLMLFSENVDYQTNDDFVRGVLVDEEILSNSVYVHKIQEGYAARVSSPALYDAISRDLVRRWIHPIVPDKFFDFDHRRNNIYLHQDYPISLLFGTNIDKNVLIGEKTKVGCGVTITNSVIGSNCEIADNVVIDGAYIWNDVTVGSNCNLSNCILAEKVILKSGVKIEFGSILGSNVIIGENVVVKEGSLIRFAPDRLEDKIDWQLVGKDGQGCDCRRANIADDFEDEDFKNGFWRRDTSAEHEVGEHWSSSDSEVGSELNSNYSAEEDDTKGNGRYCA